MNIASRKLTEADLEQMKTLLFNEGPNEWNYLTEESVNEQLTLIREGQALAVVAEDNEIMGFAVLIFGSACPEKLSSYQSLDEIAYINDVVVSQRLSGQGVGTKLLLKCSSIAKDKNFNAVYIERHEENLASAGMMRKAGFELVETTYDPAKRFSGSRNTSILMKRP
ncbi:MAG: GNAT family N-acetyltransferase [Halieaceae bacterium]